MIFSPVANFVQQSLLLPFHLILPAGGHYFWLILNFRLQFLQAIESIIRMKSLERSEIIMWNHNAGILTSAATILLHLFDSKQLKFEFRWKQKTWLFRYIGFNHNPNYYPWKKHKKKDYLNLVKQIQEMSRKQKAILWFSISLLFVFCYSLNFKQHTNKSSISSGNVKARWRNFWHSVMSNLVFVFNRGGI